MNRSTYYILSVSIIGAIITCGVYVFLFNTIKTNATEASLLSNQLDLEVRRDQRLRSIKQLTTDLSEELALVDALLVPKDGVVTFLEHIEDLGRSAGVTLTVNSVSVDGTLPTKTSYERLRIEFVASGSWSATTHLLALFETLPYGIVIEQMQLEQSKGTSRLEWELRVRFTVPKIL
jgi:hypothetical protein